MKYHNLAETPQCYEEVSLCYNASEQPYCHHVVLRMRVQRIERRG